MSERDGNTEIYTMEADGTDLLRLTSTPEEERMPDWAPVPSANVTVTATDNAFTPGSVTARPGDRVRWRFAGPSVHTATDRTGMGLFGSGSVPPGGSYAFAFVSAGSYPYACLLHSEMRGAIEIAVLARPGSGGQSTEFTITWADTAAPTRFVYDVQLKRPESTFIDWMTGESAGAATFVADAGRGAYVFRARLRNAGGDASDYPRGTSIQVR
ncbi:MAG: hypothetical protein H0W27_01745 [Actinobacteria bacterium]|nr:hypothetical protein [Actinomycetota bacterium]